MNEIEKFAKNISDLYNQKSGDIDILTARQIVKEINTFLYTSSPDLGTISALGQTFNYFSDFHKYWHLHHKEILNLQISNKVCEKAADSLHDVYIRTNGKAFIEIYNTNDLNKEDICRVRMLTGLFYI